jgi:predicted CXXCH cytochrome family protein
VTAGWAQAGRRLRFGAAAVSVAWLIGGFCSSVALAQGKDTACLKCHSDLGTNAVVHAPLQIGCSSCHDGLDARTVPHKVTGPHSKGLSAKGAALCYACHEKADFEKKVRHTALVAGCTGCHDPHSSKHEKLLTESPDALCFNCHERRDYQANVVHAPVAEGMCTGCHAAHASDHGALLSIAPIEACQACHAKVKQTPHATAGFTRTGHPVGGEKPGLQDPARPGQAFGCTSCHEPHKSDQPRLLRFDQRSPNGFCQKCHRI